MSSPTHRRGSAVATALLLGLEACSAPRKQALAPPTVSLHEAAVTGNSVAIGQHVAAGSDLDEVDSFGSTPLIAATTFGRVAAARALIGAGASLTLSNPEGSTPLHLAAFFGHPEIASSLLEHNANRNLRNDAGATAFDLVAPPFDIDRPLYEQLATNLAPLGLAFDYEAIEASRPAMRRLLRAPAEELARVVYAPEPGAGLPVSTPTALGPPPERLAELYLDAAEHETLRSLLVLRGGELVAERYFNGGRRNDKALLQSLTKSFTSALVGLALRQGCLESLDSRLAKYFPEFEEEWADAERQEITVRHLLQIRAGYPLEETDPELWQTLLSGALLRPMVDLDLVATPGAAFNYSNLSSHWLGVIVARACEIDLRSFAEERLMGPLGAQLGEWTRDRAGYYLGFAEMRLTPLDVAKFGQMYLDEGLFGGTRVVPSEWVADSLRNYSSDAWVAQPPQNHAGRYFRRLGYGYQWWSARIGDQEVDFAWGHGGQLIVLLDSHDVVIVATSSPFVAQHDAEAWKHERATLNLVGKFVQSLAEDL